MWKCPKCNQKNRIDVCSGCGYERKKDPKASISSLRFILMTILSIVIIIGIFFCVDAYIDYSHKMKSEEARLQEELSEEQYKNEADIAETELITDEEQPSPEE